MGLRVDARRSGSGAPGQCRAGLAQAEKTLGEAPEQVTASDKTPVEEAVKELKSALEKDDADNIKAAMERLEKAQHRIAEVIYRSQSQTGAGPQPGAGPEAGPGAGPPPGGDDVIDAEVVDSSEQPN